MTATSVPRWLTDAPLTVEGVLSDASNLTLRVTVEGTGESVPAPADASVPAPADRLLRRAVYKPVRGERPLHDFPTGTLAGREVSAYLVSEWGGWHLVPPTILRDGPLGPGSVQVWVEEDPRHSQEPATGLLSLRRPDDLPPGWLPVLSAQDGLGEPLVLAHADHPDLAGLAVLDLVLNNADRKAAHIARDRAGGVWGFDHGLCGHAQPKLRTVLWGWAGELLPPQEVSRLERLLAVLGEQGSACLEQLLSPTEVLALGERVAALLRHPTFPDVPAGRYPLPWPLW